MTPLAAMLDGLFQRYGWDWNTYQQQPEWLLEELNEVIRANNDHAENERRRQSNDSRGASHRGSAAAPARDHAELMQQAAAAGFLQAEPPEE